MADILDESGGIMDTFFFVDVLVYTGEVANFSLISVVPYC